MKVCALVKKPFQPIQKQEIKPTMAHFGEIIGTGDVEVFRLEKNLHVVHHAKSPVPNIKYWGKDLVFYGTVIFLQVDDSGQPESMDDTDARLWEKSLNLAFHSFTEEIQSPDIFML